MHLFTLGSEVLFYSTVRLNIGVAESTSGTAALVLRNSLFGAVFAKPVQYISLLLSQYCNLM